MDATVETPATRRIRVWDLPTRLSHWAIVTLFGICWWAAKSDHMRWHRIAGYAMIGVVWFRLAWGFWGGQTARFSDFVRGPTTTLRYVRKLLSRGIDDAPTPLGHNPLGALSVLAMFALLVSQTTSGLFAVDVDGVASGPLAHWVSFDTGRRFAHWHATNFHLLLALIGVHLCAIAYYRFARHEKLVPAMIHGCKAPASTAAAPYFVSRWRAVWLAAGILLGVILLVNAR